MYVAVWIGVSIVAVPLVGFCYQWLGGWADRRLMGPGGLVDIGGGQRLYSVEKGRGAPTVVFESGFARLQFELDGGAGRCGGGGADGGL